METQALEIATLNNAFRRSSEFAHFTGGVRSTVTNFDGLVYAIATFNVFSEDNDPWDEHDFGSLTYEGHKIFWKIDYYDQELKYWCDPLSPQCRRVMTVMLAEEY